MVDRCAALLLLLLQIADALFELHVAVRAVAARGTICWFHRSLSLRCLSLNLLVEAVQEVEPCVALLNDHESSGLVLYGPVLLCLVPECFGNGGKTHRRIEQLGKRQPCLAGS